MSSPNSAGAAVTRPKVWVFEELHAKLTASYQTPKWIEDAKEEVRRQELSKRKAEADAAAAAVSPVVDDDCLVVEPAKRARVLIDLTDADGPPRTPAVAAVISQAAPQSSQDAQAQQTRLAALTQLLVSANDRLRDLRAAPDADYPNGDKSAQIAGVRRKIEDIEGKLWEATMS